MVAQWETYDDEIGGCCNLRVPACAVWMRKYRKGFEEGRRSVQQCLGQRHTSYSPRERELRLDDAIPAHGFIA